MSDAQLDTTTFADQSAIFLRQLSTRNRNPVKPATLKAYNSYLDHWILPLIGNQQLASFGNGAMKQFVGQLISGGLGPKTTLEIVSLVKQIIASAVTDEGDYRYPRVWNHKFLDLPSIGAQKQPTISDEQIKLAMKDKYKVFWAFLLGSGLRIGEAQAVRIGDNGTSSAWIAERAVIIVRTSIWNRKEQAPKTPAAIREVDIHPSLNQLLVEFSRGASIGGYLFRNRKGGPLWSKSLVTHLKKMGIQGFHTTRRFRTTHLRGIEGIPEQLIKFWLGHEMKANITDRYSKICRNESLRKLWSEKASLGFVLPEVKPGDPRPQPTQASAPVEPGTLVVEPAPYVATDDDLPIELFEPSEALAEAK